MPSLKNMMNVQVKLEPLPQSILQQPHGTINLANGSAPNLLPFLQPPTVKAEQHRARTQEKGRPKKTENQMSSAVPKEDIKPNFQMQMKHEPMEHKEPLLSIPTFPNMHNQPRIPGQPTMPGAFPVRKKRDRFNGMPEEEVLKRFLPDHFTHGLDIAIVGINPGLLSAYVGHHYPSAGNHFWKCLYLSGLIPEPMKAVDDYKLLELGIGFTNMVERTSRGSSDLSRKEIKAGGEILKEKIKKYRPKIAVFNGKGIFEVFCGHKNFSFGKQPVHFPGCEETLMFVMPSSSARCTQLPRAADKVPFYVALRKLRDYLRGDIKKLDDSEVIFPVALKTAPSIEAKVEEKIDGKPPTKKMRKKAEKVKLNDQQHDLIQQAVQQVKQEDGPFMPPPPISAGGQMPGMFPPPPNQPQMMQQLQNPHRQPVSSGANTGPMGGAGFSMPPHSSWGNMNPGAMSAQENPRQQGSSGMGQDFYPQHWPGAPQPPHAHPASQPPQQQQQQPAMTPSWSAGAPPMPGGSSWMPPHQQYMKPPMHGGQPPPYHYGGQYGAGGQNPQGQPFPYPGFSPHLMHDSRDQNSGMYDPKVKDEPRWSQPH